MAKPKAPQTAVKVPKSSIKVSQSAAKVPLSVSKNRNLSKPLETEEDQISDEMVDFYYNRYLQVRRHSTSSF